MHGLAFHSIHFASLNFFKIVARIYICTCVYRDRLESIRRSDSIDLDLEKDRKVRGGNTGNIVSHGDRWGREGKETNRCYRAPIINANHFSKACLIFKHAAMKPLSREQAEG